MKERITLAVATVLTAIGIYLVPAWQNFFKDVCLQAAVFAAATIVVMHVTRLLGRRGITMERIVLALFLAGMPFVYVIRWFGFRGGASTGWLWIELFGLVVYVALAVLGLKVSPWLLVAGIAAHGIGWDSWHYDSVYIPNWYAIGCLLADIGLSVYIAARIPAWRDWRVRQQFAPK